MKPLTGFLTRLARDTRGNTLAIMAAAVFPLIGMIGGGFDLSRMYIVKTRLQHACDAGALAGRRIMGGGTWAQNGGQPEQTAMQFFNSNMADHMFGATGLEVAFTESAGRVTGNASADVPMTLMRVFGYEEMPMSVTCDAEMRLPNTDVMFVLDVTGSMDQTLTGDSQNKITGLRIAVRCFYEILARLNTEANCDGGDPSGGTGEDTQIRFGFVPYSTNVNVGRLLPSTFFRDEWSYQSRRPDTVFGRFDSWDGSNMRNQRSYSAWEDTGSSKVVSRSSDCNESNLALPADEYVASSSATAVNGDSESSDGFRAWLSTLHRDYQRIYVSSTRTCKIQSRTRLMERRAWFDWTNASNPDRISVPSWRYEQIDVDLTGLKNGTGWNASFTRPLGYGGADLSIPWSGCIEERQTVRATSYLPIPADAFDLDLDRLPTTDDSRWAPALDTLSYARRDAPANGDYDRAAITTFTNFGRGSFACPTEARLLQEWDDPDAFDNYVDSLQTGGNTYHDIGLIWGGRLMSPTGIFAAQNAATPEGGEIERHMIFMTDGDACTAGLNYQAYGLAWYDRRQTPDSTDPGTGQTCSSNNPGVLTRQVDARTSAVCEAIKNRNITLWVIWFGQSQPAIETHLRNCATPDRFFSARNSLQLQQTFRSIANQISQLRLTS